MKRILLILLTFIISVSILSYVLAVEPPAGYRQLMDYQIFEDTVNGWSGSGNDELETVNSNLPVDTEETYDSKPSLRLNVTETVSSGWWMSLITVRDWNIHDFSEYVVNGYLEFNIKGKDGGESFMIGFRDKVYERDEGLEVDITKNINYYITITTEWEKVKIPLAELMDDPGSAFDPANVLCMLLQNTDTRPFTIWINDIKITSTDNEQSAPAIKLNQLGYLKDTQEKQVLITRFAEELAVNENTEFEIKNADDNSTVYVSTLNLISEYEAVDSGEKIYSANFSDFDKPGKYYITIPGEDIEDSPVFEIGEDIYNSLLIDSARYFYYQRQGIGLEEPYCTDYPRQDMTPQDANAVFASGNQSARNVTKGWYDAGDFGKYVNAGATALSDMFWAYEMFSSKFTDNQFNIPESGNGVPDILDEAKWELEWMFKMQDQESGGFYPRVQSDDDENVTQRIIKDQNGPSTDDTACATAILAHAYLIYRDIDLSFASECLAAAERAWTFLENNPDDIVSPSGPYNVSDDSSDRLWAASSLFRATGYEIYHNYFRDNYQGFASKFEDENAYAHGWGDMWMPAFFQYLKEAQETGYADPEITSWIANEFSIWSGIVSDRYSNNPWNNPVIAGNYYWGINMQIMNVPQSAYIGYKLLNMESTIVEGLIFKSLNWLLGMNPLRFSFVSGYGEDTTERVYSNIYNNDGIEGIPAGYMPGGPNAYNGEGLSRFAAKCYVHSAADWVTNEHTVYWNSSLLFNAAFASSYSGNSDEIIPGDVNGDGNVDSLDQIIFRRYILGIITEFPTENGFQAADLNDDGTVDSVDSILLRRLVLGIGEDEENEISMDYTVFAFSQSILTDDDPQWGDLSL